MIVMKFGGSSVESSTALFRLAETVRAHRSSHPVVVVSAIGKTTDQLVRIGSFAADFNPGAALEELDLLKNRHTDIINEFLPASSASAVTELLDSHIDELTRLISEISTLEHLTPELSDLIRSFGERLSSLIVCAVLNAAGISSTHLEARNMIVTNDHFSNATPLYCETYAKIRRAVLRVSCSHVPVLGGFIGATESGVTTTLGRGGSDFTAALVGAALSVDEIQIWTDVNGMLTCDPRIVPGGYCLSSISYAEAETMAQFGAKVIHPATVAPARQKRIPITIRNSRSPATQGTLISTETAIWPARVKSIASRQNTTVVRLKLRDQSDPGPFLQKVRDAFAVHRINIDLVSTGYGLCVVSDCTWLPASLLGDLDSLAAISILHNQTLICLVGESLQQASSIQYRANLSLRSAGIEIGLEGETLNGLVFAVEAAHLTHAVRTLHEEFFPLSEEAPSQTCQERLSSTVLQLTT